jgi:hypothetical protein
MNPMNRSMPVHNAPAITCMKSRNHMLGLRRAAVIITNATIAATRYHGRSGDVRTGDALRVVSAKAILDLLNFK